jgi:type II secretory ATPase GspE/PulE/Tfp pilus assembly ATPase PilB-like protein
VTAVAPQSAELARARGLAARAELSWIDLDAVTIDPDAVQALPLATQLAQLAVPYAYDAGILLVAVADPLSIRALERTLAVPHRFVVAPRASVQNVLNSLRQVERNSSPVLVAGAFGSGPDPEIGVIGRAAEAGATDVHFVPCSTGIAVRARIDGHLREIGRIALDAAPATTARLKVKAGLDIAEQRRSQEGRLALSSGGGREFDLRVTTVPTVAGEGVALRILERQVQPPTLTELGLSPDAQLKLERLVNEQRGALLVTGPTGSGKSTTVFAAVADIQRPELNVMTVEDPVEYRIDGIYQVEVNPSTNVTYESALRSVLRTDPDVVVVGELRDLATCSAALKSALSGSFVLSTLHTDDAPGAVTRLLDIGVEPYVIAATVSGVLAQRLVRRLCVFCRERFEPSPYERTELGLDDGEHHLFRAHGCAHCDRGYRGQTGIHQLMVVDDDVRRLTLARASHEEVTAAARAAGMRSLWEDGLEKAAAGITSIDEIRRVAF